MRLYNYFIFLLLAITITISTSYGKQTSSQPLIFQVKEEQILLDKNNVESASIVSNDNGTYAGLDITLKSAAAKQIADLTANNIGKAATLTLGNKIVATILIGLQLNKQFIITNISREDAQAIVNSIH